MMNITYDFELGSWNASWGLEPHDLQEPPDRHVVSCRNRMNEIVKKRGRSGKTLSCIWTARFDTERDRWVPRSDLERAVDLGDAVMIQKLTRVRTGKRSVEYSYREWMADRYPCAEGDVIVKNPIETWAVKE